MKSPSNLEFDMEPADLGLAKLLISALRRYSSSIDLRFRKRQRKNPAPTRAQNPTTPTTTPAAIAAVLGPESFLLSEVPSVSLAAVTMTVCPPLVSTVPVVLELPSVVEEEPSVLTSSLVV